MNIRTVKRIELVDITLEVNSEVHKSGIDNGICVVSTSHTTTAIILNENETGLRHDILDFLYGGLTASQVLFGNTEHV